MEGTQRQSSMNKLLLQRGDVLTTDEGRKVFGKVDLHVLPFIFLATFFCYVDRANLVISSNDLCDYLKLDDAQFSSGNFLFLLGLLVFQIPSNLVMERVHAGKWLGMLLFGWGLVAALSVLAKNAIGFYVCRFLLGALEAGIMPGLWYYCTLFYPEPRLVIPFTVIEIGRFSAKFLSIPFAGWVTLIGSGLGAWQWLGIFEGVLAGLVGLFLFFAMPGGLTDAFFLKLKDARYLRKEMRGTTAPEPPLYTQGRKRMIRELRGTLLTGGIWAVSAVKFSTRMTGDLLYLWTPVLLHNFKANQGLEAHTEALACAHEQFGYEAGITPNWAFAAIAYGVAVVTSIVLALTSQRFRERKYHVAGTVLAAAAALILVPPVDAVAGSKWQAGFAFLSVGVISVMSSGGPLVAFASSFLPSEMKAVGLAALSFICHLAGYLGVLITNSLIINHETYTTPILVTAATLVIGGIVTLVLPDPIKMKKPPSLPVDSFMTEEAHKSPYVTYEAMKSQEGDEEGPISTKPITPSPLVSAKGSGSTTGLPPSTPPESLPADPPVSSGAPGDVSFQFPSATLVVLYDFQAEMEGEMSVFAGEVLELAEEEKEGWVVARRGDELGLVPSGFVQFQ